MRKLITKGEAAKLLNMTKSQIRFYEQKGLIKPQMDEKGYALYGFDEIDRLELIILLKDLNTPIKDMKQIMDDDNQYDYQALLNQAHGSVVAEIERLNYKKHQFEQRLKAYNEVESNTFNVKYINERILYYLEDAEKINTIKEIYDVSMTRNIGYLDYDNEFLILYHHNEEEIGFVNTQNKVLDKNAEQMVIEAGDYLSYVVSYDYNDDFNIYKEALRNEAERRGLIISETLIFIDHFGRKFYERYKVIGTFQAKIQKR